MRTKIKKVKLSDIISEHFFKTFNSRKRYQIDFQPRSSTKTSKNSIKIALEMLNNRGLEVAVLRENYTDHRKSTYRELITAFKRLGYNLKPGVHYPAGNSTALWIKIPENNNYVHFLHLHDLESLKGVVPYYDDGYIAIAWFFEATQFRSEVEAINQAVSSLSRGVKPFYYNIVEFNPHRSISHWTYDWLNNMKQRPDVIINEGTYLDIPEYKRNLWFGELLNEIEQLKQVDYKQYAYIYLGQTGKLDNAVFHNLNLSVHHTQLLPEKYAQVTVGMDYGNSDGTSFVELGLKAKLSGIHVISEYYHRNAISPVKKTIEEYTNDAVEYLKEVKERHPSNVIQVYVDSANVDFRNVLEVKVAKSGLRGVQINRVSKTKKASLQSRIDTINLMLGTSDFIKINQQIKYVVKALDLAEYNQKTAKMIDNTSTYYTDAYDAFCYSWMHLIDSIQSVVLRKQTEVIT